MADICPVTSAYLSAVRAVIESRTLFENHLEQWQDLHALALTAGVSRERQHQRAFLCIELMQWSLKPLVTSELVALDLIPKQKTSLLTWSRSREGLNQLLAAIREDDEDLKARCMEVMLLPNRARARGVDQIAENRDRFLTQLHELMSDAAKTLRRALKNPAVPLTSVGRALGEAAEQAQIGVPAQLTFASQLLAQTENLAPRAWEL